VRDHPCGDLEHHHCGGDADYDSGAALSNRKIMDKIVRVFPSGLITAVHIYRISWPDCMCKGGRRALIESYPSA
jgi:hypothetical protein